ncbi:MAG: hypothetical protein ABSG43_04860, partial [Solirubrobacteraceae bacterium]
EAPAEWSWFCGHCAAPSPGGQAPFPTARVCRSCGLGLLLEAPADAVPSGRDAFLVIDSSLLVQALSGTAETLLAVTEDLAINRPVTELLVAADAEGRSQSRFAAAVAQTAGANNPTQHVFVRPWNTFGVRMRVRIAPCGPPRAALLGLEQKARLRSLDR